jgi:hypothetical protein
VRPASDRDKDHQQHRVLREGDDLRDADARGGVGGGDVGFVQIADVERHAADRCRGDQGHEGPGQLRQQRPAEAQLLEHEA